MSWEFATSIGMVGTSGILFFIGYNLDKIHNLLRLFYFFMGIVVMVIATNHAVLIISENSGSVALQNSAAVAYQSVIIFFLGLLLYFVISLFVTIVKSVKLKRIDRRDMDSLEEEGEN